MNKKPFKLKFTGERMIPEISKGTPIFYEHLARYFFACQLTTGKVVLDAGCGAGYGSYIVAKYGLPKKVYSVDISSDAIKYAKKKYGKSSINFINDNIEDFSNIQDNSIDIVIAFEAVEHIDSPDKFLNQVKRILKPDGIIVLSTPNKYTYADSNPFHVQEFYPADFTKLLKKYFKKINIYYQGFEFSQIIKTEGQKEFSLEENFNKTIQEVYSTPQQSKDVQYLIALCSDNKTPNLNGTQLSTRKIGNFNFEQGFVSLGKQLGAYQTKINELDDQLLKTQRYLQEIDAELINIKSSHLFKFANFYYYVKHGLKYKVLKFLKTPTEIIQKGLQEKYIDIAIPIYNAFEQVRRCIYSVLSNTYGLDYNLILIDDYSSDKRIKYLLDYLRNQNIPGLHILENKKNLGFVKTVNRALNLSKSDIILLNSDTLVTKDWAKKILATAYTNNKIGTVTPLSNNATILSIPETNINNYLPDNLSLNDLSNILYQIKQKLKIDYIKIPTGIGFCLFIKRMMINKFGVFDEVYGRGYNEENDFCQRIAKEGFLNVTSIDTFVFHEGEKSFVKKKRGLDAKNHQLLMKRYPSYMDGVIKFINKDPLKVVRKELNKYLENLNKEKLIKIAIDCQIFHLSPNTGSARYVEELIDNYPEGYEDKVVLLTQKDNINELSKHKTKFDTFFTTNSLDPIIGRLDFKLYHRTIQCYTYDDLALIVHSQKSVLTLLDLISYKEQSYWEDENKWREYQEITNLSAQLADKIICISDYAKNEIVKYLSINPKKVETIYLGVNNKFKEIKDKNILNKFKKQFCLPSTFLLYIGTDFPHKNLLQLIGFYSVLPKHIKEILKLVLFIKHSGVGNINLVRKKVIQLGLENDVVILEKNFSNDDLNLLYNSCFAYTNFSTDEGFGMTNLEAARCGKPAVVLDTSFNREILKEGGLYFKTETDFINSISELLNNHLFYNKISQKGKKVSLEYTWEKTTEKTYKVYSQELKNNPENNLKLKKKAMDLILRKSKYGKLIEGLISL